MPSPASAKLAHISKRRRTTSRRYRVWPARSPRPTTTCSVPCSATPPEASALLRAYLPQAISRQLLWSTLAWQPVGFIDDRLRDSESDLLYLIQRKADAAPAWLYVLLEHQSTPDAWLRFAAAEVQHPHLGTGSQPVPQREATAPHRAAGVVSGQPPLAPRPRVLGVVCPAGPGLARSAALRAPLDRPDQGSAGSGARRTARSHRATGAAGGVPGKLGPCCSSWCRCWRSWCGSAQPRTGARS